jgi:hypothetical protein
MPAPESRSAPRSSLPGSFRSTLSALLDGAETTKRPPVSHSAGGRSLCVALDGGATM